MKFLKAHKIALLAIVALLFSVVAWAAEEFKMPEFNKIPSTKPQGSWIVYWNFNEGMKDAERLKLDTLVVFGASYDKDANLMLPTELDFAQINALKKKNPGQKQYLSFINDVTFNSGKQIAKDTNILEKMFSTKQSMQRHADEIVSLAVEYKMQGIELDFENIWKDEKLVNKFVVFCDLLQHRAQAEGLELRVVLEPKTLPYAEKFKLDAEYVVMFYNLYGGHSGAGPKANKRFINKTLDQMDNLGGAKATKVAAFAGGGFRWLRNTKVINLTQAQAEKIAKQNKAFVERDRSGAKYFYYDEKDARACVYYGDKKTFDYWTSLAKAKGIERCDLWCLGGNNW